jgi:hypothetical protein
MTIVEHNDEMLLPPVRTIIGNPLAVPIVEMEP